ncbi:pentatricopeptide repeat-containing protein At4g22760 isoform X2 [Amaranthus tricolor]|uniref:pentatricopeptide repeat-containing protein At4g22760 isoform X2 n=1 Tax=Amaranthus tricolor TaxID=29722 RepID=UPI00258D5075|nr:pentatricopeptide repeat-containing protein At4g22760 isoform X2 [Amaranthus tricolor]XP_057520061.1 pentatricopeptide repeat-containing protein At4g22760 isoform X2 [Amaranthus tricolor]XP_057520063.1 pentatricopeptide repeat-containing protein At4g22760 isoform X2 [Amaranthus tricolor]XP_057520064.1 pentatricopeptide repeat-containing protein At4g22760 isoform X2 [Amaranthus tricolor]
MPLSQVNTILSKCLTVNQAKQLHAQLVVNSLGDLETELVCHLITSIRNFTPTVVHYIQTILRYLKHPDCFSWSCVIRSFAQHGLFREAFSLHVQMQRSGIHPSTFSLSSSLRSCARISNKDGGVSIHAQAHKYKIFQSVYVKTALLDFYAKLGDMKAAKKLFDEISDKNVVSWNSLLAGYLKSRDLSMATQLFNKMPVKDIVSWNSMLSGYTRSGVMDKAYLLFQQMSDRNSASWNAMISGYVDCGNIKMARSFFDAMPRRNSISLITLISGYSKCGDVDAAHKLFLDMPKKDVPSFNSMIACYAQNSRPKEAIQLFKDMVGSELVDQPDKMTLASVISACAQLGDLDYGSWIELYMRRLGIELDDHLATALLDLYAKCGSIDKAYELFHGLAKKDVVAYTAMILGCGINGKPHDAFKLFQEMIDANISPNLITFTGILTAYSHAGLIEKGYHCFNLIRKFGLMPSTDQYAIMVDLLGRAGRLEEAYDLIKNMPIPPHSGVWGALLLACRLHNNIELAEIAAQMCFELESDKAGYSSLLANTYTLNDRWDDVDKLKKNLKHVGLARIPGCSWL